MGDILMQIHSCKEYFIKNFKKVDLLTGLINADQLKFLYSFIISSYKSSLNIFYFIIRNGIGQKLYNSMIALSIYFIS